VRPVRSSVALSVGGGDRNDRCWCGRTQALAEGCCRRRGRALAERTVAAAPELLAWSASLGPERLWALEDCRQLTRPLERTLLTAGESLVGVPPKLIAPQRRAGRMRGKSDAIDALAGARAALREPRLDHPRPGEQRLRELKLLLDHRDDLIDERRRAQQRLRAQLHDLDPELAVPLDALDRGLWLDRLGRRLARLEQQAQVRITRELLSRCRGLTRTILQLDRELEQRATAPRLLALPGCGAISASKLLGEIGAIARFETDAQLSRHAGVAPLEASSGKHQRHRLDRAGNRQLNRALHRIAITKARIHPPARAYLKRKHAEGKSRREALRSRKRQLARVVYTTLKASPTLT
jgi:transposase